MQVIFQSSDLLSEAFDVFGDDVDNDTFAGILINSKLRKALMGMLFVFIPRVSLRLPWAMRSLGIQPVQTECNQACLNC